MVVSSSTHLKGLHLESQWPLARKTNCQLRNKPVWANMCTRSRKAGMAQMRTASALLRQSMIHCTSKVLYLRVFSNRSSLQRMQDHWSTERLARLTNSNRGLWRAATIRITTREWARSRRIRAERPPVAITRTSCSRAPITSRRLLLTCTTYLNNINNSRWPPQTTIRSPCKEHQSKNWANPQESRR